MEIIRFHFFSMQSNNAIFVFIRVFNYAYISMMLTNLVTVDLLLAF